MRSEDKSGMEREKKKQFFFYVCYILSRTMAEKNIHEFTIKKIRTHEQGAS